MDAPLLVRRDEVERDLRIAVGLHSRHAGGGLEIDRRPVVLTGPNGAGKTTLISLISGMMPCNEGQILFRDVDLTRAKPHARVAAGLDPRRHIANSAALITRPDLHLDLVRPGIAIYGLNPVPVPTDLRPVMTFRSAVALVKRIPAGESVSYGLSWTARSDTNLALVPVGYADGVPRSERFRDIYFSEDFNEAFRLGNDPLAIGQRAEGDHGYIVALGDMQFGKIDGDGIG